MKSSRSLSTVAVVFVDTCPKGFARICMMAGWGVSRTRILKAGLRTDLLRLVGDYV